MNFLFPFLFEFLIRLLISIDNSHRSIDTWEIYFRFWNEQSDERDKRGSIWFVY